MPSGNKVCQPHSSFCTSVTTQLKTFMLLTSIKICAHCNAAFSLLQWALYAQQFRAMLIKRAVFSWRHWKLLLLQLLALLGLMYLLMRGINFSKPREPGRVMDLEQYGETIVPFSISGDPDLTKNLTKNLEIMLKAKKQELHDVQGKSLTTRERAPVDGDLLIVI